LSTPGIAFDEVRAPSSARRQGRWLITPGGESRPSTRREARPTRSTDERRLADSGLSHGRRPPRGRSAGAQSLPRRHQQRVIPRARSGAATPTGLLLRVRRAASFRSDFERPAIVAIRGGVSSGKVSRFRAREPSALTRGRSGLADVARFELGELLAIRSDRIREGACSRARKRSVAGRPCSRPPSEARPRRGLGRRGRRRPRRPFAARGEHFTCGQARERRAARPK